VNRLEKRLQTKNYKDKFIFDDTQEEIEDTSLEEESHSLIKDYEDMQKRARKAELEQIRRIEAENPHQLRAEMLNDPTPKGVYEMNIMGRKIDLSQLENYVLKKISPKPIVNKMRYDNAKTLDEIKGYGKKTKMKINVGMLLWILGMMGVFVIGTILFFMGPNLGQVFQSLFGG